MWRCSKTAPYICRWPSISRAAGQVQPRGRNVGWPARASGTDRSRVSKGPLDVTGPGTVFLWRPSATVLVLRRRSGMHWYNKGASSRGITRYPAVLPERAVSPSPSTIVVDAKNISLSSLENWRSSPCHVRPASVRANHIHRSRSAPDHESQGSHILQGGKCGAN